MNTNIIIRDFLNKNNIRNLKLSLSILLGNLTVRMILSNLDNFLTRGQIMLSRMKRIAVGGDLRDILNAISNSSLSLTLRTNNIGDLDNARTRLIILDRSRLQIIKLMLIRRADNRNLNLVDKPIDKLKLGGLSIKNGLITPADTAVLRRKRTNETFRSRTINTVQRILIRRLNDLLTTPSIKQSSIDGSNLLNLNILSIRIAIGNRSQGLDLDNLLRKIVPAKVLNKKRSSNISFIIGRLIRHLGLLLLVIILNQEMNRIGTNVLRYLLGILLINNARTTLEASDRRTGHLLTKIQTTAYITKATYNGTSGHDDEDGRNGNLLPVLRGCSSSDDICFLSSLSSYLIAIHRQRPLM